MEKDPANQLMVQISPLFTGFLYTSQVFSLFLPSTVSGQSVPKTCWNEYSFVFTTCTCFTVPLHPTSPERRPEKKSAITRLESAKHEKHVTCHNHSSICWEPCLIALTMTSIQCTLLMFHSNINYSANGVNTLNFQPWVDWLSWRCRIFRWVCRWWLGRKICEHAKVDTRGKNHWEWLQKSCDEQRALLKLTPKAQNLQTSRRTDSQRLLCHARTIPGPFCQDGHTHDKNSRRSSQDTMIGNTWV